MPEKKIALQKCRELISNSHSEMTNEDIEEIRDCLYRITYFAIEQYLNENKNNDDRETN